jgi:hypothetical protein
VSAYAVFAIRDPDRLQSEEYLLRQQEILILSKSGEAKDPTKLDLKPNPEMDNASPGGENG